jgi:hypothetical protein
VLGAVAVVPAGCGARSGLLIPPPAPPPPECYITADCADAGNLCEPVVCLAWADVPYDPAIDGKPDGGSGLGGAGGAGGAGAGGAGGAGVVGGGGAGGVVLPTEGGRCRKLEPVDCDDLDPCTADTCDPFSGACYYELATRDNDGDGFRGPRPGTKPGDPDACGDDCDDTSELAYPGGVEVCDGVDNDCNGIIDDNAQYVPLLADPVRVSSDGISPASPGGLGYSGSSYLAIYGGNADGFDMYRSELDDQGDAIAPGETLFTLGNADSYGGPVIWIGDRYGVAWQDRRNGDYEIYFSLLDEKGNKVELGDTRLSFAPGFSINVSLAWSGTEFVVVWQDERTDNFELFGQLLDIDGVPQGGNVQLTDAESFFQTESPSVAAGTDSIGIAWNIGEPGQHWVRFRTFDRDLTPRGETISLTDGFTDAVYPVVVWNKDRYVVVWYDKTAPEKAIYAATLDEDANLIDGPVPVTDPGPFRSRYPNLRPLGDRLLLVYADDRDQNDGYELYSTMFSSALLPVTAEQRLTFAGRDSIYPSVAFGKDGAVGVLFRDDREDEPHVFFTQLGCLTNPD